MEVPKPIYSLNHGWIISCNGVCFQTHIPPIPWYWDMRFPLHFIPGTAPHAKYHLDTTTLAHENKICSPRQCTKDNHRGKERKGKTCLPFCYTVHGNIDLKKKISISRHLPESCLITIASSSQLDLKITLTIATLL